MLVSSWTITAQSRSRHRRTDYSKAAILERLLHPADHATESPITAEMCILTMLACTMCSACIRAHVYVYANITISIMAQVIWLSASQPEMTPIETGEGRELPVHARIAELHCQPQSNDCNIQGNSAWEKRVGKNISQPLWTWLADKSSI